MWDLSGPGLKPASPALAGRFLTTAPPGKSLSGTLDVHLVNKSNRVIQKVSSLHGMCWVSSRRAVLARDLLKQEIHFPLWVDEWRSGCGGLEMGITNKQRKKTVASSAFLVSTSLCSLVITHLFQITLYSLIQCQVSQSLLFPRV